MKNRVFCLIFHYIAHKALEGKIKQKTSFFMIFEYASKPSFKVIQGIYTCFEGSEKPFPSSDCIFEHLRPYGRPYYEESKTHENRNNRDFGQKYDFRYIGRYHAIC